MGLDLDDVKRFLRYDVWPKFRRMSLLIIITALNLIVISVWLLQVPVFDMLPTFTCFSSPCGAVWLTRSYMMTTGSDAYAACGMWDCWRKYSDSNGEHFETTNVDSKSDDDQNPMDFLMDPGDIIVEKLYVTPEQPLRAIYLTRFILLFSALYANVVLLWCVLMVVREALPLFFPKKRFFPSTFFMTLVLSILMVALSVAVTLPWSYFFLCRPFYGPSGADLGTGGWGYGWSFYASIIFSSPIYVMTCVTVAGTFAGNIHDVSRFLLNGPPK